MNKKDILDKIKSLDGLSNEERAYLINLVNTKKKYGLVWEDKPEQVEEDLRTKLPVLKEVKERAIINDTETEKHPNHILIEGDNLHALTALSFTHEGKIDVIYIDPPYNTGNKDFKYNDSFVDKEDGYRHSKWLSFIEKRLKVAKRLLNENGVIFISIDDNEQAQLKILCDEIFGEGNFKNILAIRRRSKSLNLQFAENGLKSLNVGYEYVVVYSKNVNKLFEPIRKKKINARTSGTWNVFWSNADRPTMRYSLIGFTPKTGQWRWSKELAFEAVENYKKYLYEYANNITLEEYWKHTGEQLRFVRRIEGGKGKNGGIQYWVPPSQTSLRTTNWTDIEVSEIHKEFDFNFNNPKNKSLIKELILFSDFPKKNNPLIILDFFAGSGTTLHATMSLNSDDGGERQCIIATNNENNICEEVAYERNKRVIQGYTNAKGQEVEGLKKNNLRYYQCDFVQRNPTLDNKRQLTQLATELLCIREDCYHPVSHHLSFSDKEAQIYTSGRGKYLVAIYYSRNQIAVQEQLIEWILAVTDATEKIRLYGFSPEKETLAEEFAAVEDKIEAVALPEAIYNAYLATFKTIKVDKKDYALTKAGATETDPNH